MIVCTFVACDLGYYGNNCRHRCSVNCSKAYDCDKFTGQCIGGCKPGWTGFMCDQGKKVLMMLYVFSQRILP